MLRGLRPFPALRLLALLVLAMGLLAKPLLVAACELDDVARAHVGIAQLAADAGDAGDAGEDCCPGKVCGECCTAATVLAVAPLLTAAPLLAPGPRQRTWVRSDPATLPVDIRPPISA